MKPSRWAAILSLSAIVCAVWAPAPTRAQEPVDEEGYMLVVDRPWAGGDRFELQTRVSDSRTLSQSLNGQSIGEELTDIQAQLTGIVEVLEVDDDGDLKAIAITVQDYEGTLNEVTVPIDTETRVLLRVVEGEVVGDYENAGKLSPEALQVMDSLFTYFLDSVEDDVDENAVYNIDQPRLPGQRWACNNQLIAEELSDHERLVFRAEDIESEFGFVRVTEFADQPAMDMVFTVNVSAIEIPLLAQQGYKFEESSFIMTVAGQLPLDPESNHGTMNVNLQLQMRAALDLPDGQGQAVLSLEGSMNGSVTYHPVD